MDRPSAVTTSFLLWLIAIGSGLFETVLVVTDGIVNDSLSTSEMMSGAGVRGVVFVVAAILAFRMRAGSTRARLALTLLLGVLGLGSLLIGPIGWLVDGAPNPNFRTVEWFFAASRAVHVAAVLGALAAMYRPAARAWFAITRA